jgi:cell division protein FtsQ
VSGPGGSPVSLRDGGTSRPEPTPPGRRPAGRYRRRRLAALIVVGAMAIAGAAAWALLGSGLFAVRSVTVTGAHLVPDSEILAAAAVRPGTPLIRVNTGQVAARVVAIRQVIAVHVTTSWPDHVVIAVQERTAALAVPLPGSGFDLVDANGVVVQEARTRPRTLPLFSTAAAPSALAGDPDVAAVAAVLGELPASVRSAVTSATAPEPDQVTLQLRSGVTILWGGSDDAAAKAAELAALMPANARYYDVSSPTTAVTSNSPG